MALKVRVPLEALGDIISSFPSQFLFPYHSTLILTPVDYQADVFIKLTAVIPPSPSGVVIAHLEFIIMQVKLFFSGTLHLST